MPVAYLALHEVFAELVPPGPDAPAALLAFVVIGAVAPVRRAVGCRSCDPTVRSCRRLRPWIYAGLFLDDAFTRLAFAVVATAAPTAPTDAAAHGPTVVAVDPPP